MLHPNAPEEAQAGGEIIDVQSGRDPGSYVGQPVGQGVGQFHLRRGARLVHVVAADADAVEARHVLGRVGEDVGYDPHARPRRVDIGVADHELLQDVVLYGAGQLLRPHPLPLGGHDVEGHYGQYGPVHGHTDRHLLQRNLVEEPLHILHRIDGHPGLTDVAAYPLVVAVVAPMGGQVEGDRQSPLPGGEVAAVESIRFGGGTEAGVLPDCPGPARIHTGVGAAQVGRVAGHGGERLVVGRGGLAAEGMIGAGGEGGSWHTVRVAGKLRKRGRRTLENHDTLHY